MIFAFVIVKGKTEMSEYFVVKSGSSRVAVVDLNQQSDKEYENSLLAIGYGDKPNHRKFAYLENIDFKNGEFSHQIRYRFVQMDQNGELRTGFNLCGNATAAVAVAVTQGFAQRRKKTPTPLQITDSSLPVGECQATILGERNGIFDVDLSYLPSPHPLFQKDSCFLTDHVKDRVHDFVVSLVSVPNLYVFMHFPNLRQYSKSKLDTLGSELFLKTREFLEGLLPQQNFLQLSEAVPKVALIDLSEDGLDAVMYSAHGQQHLSFAVTGGVALGYLMGIPGTIPYQLLGNVEAVTIRAGDRELSIRRSGKRISIKTEAQILAQGFLLGRNIGVERSIHGLSCHYECNRETNWL